MDVAITKMSSKGQVVIPSELREDIHEGEKLIVIKDGNRLIIKKVEEQSEHPLAKAIVESFEEEAKGIRISSDVPNFSAK